MFQFNKKKLGKGAQQNKQSWKPHWAVSILYRVWMVLFGAFKIAVGALATVALICIVCAFSFAGILGDYLEGDILPSAGLVLEDLEMDSPSYVYYVDNDGNIVELQELYASVDWKKADYEDIPEHMIHAAVAIEDKRFYEHQGVDWITTVKAFANMFFGDETVGGSSITQQLIKNKTGEDSVTVQRKVLEFFRATLVEKNYDKKVILEEYMNSIYMGQGCRGVRSAAIAYFGKELQMLTAAECASLISITNNPSLFDPYSSAEFKYAGEMMNGKQRNRHRQLLVLGEMLNQGYLTQEEYDEAVAQELVLKSKIAEEDVWTECANESCPYEGIRKTFGSSGALKCPECGTAPVIDKAASQEVYSYFVDAVLEDVAKDLAEQNGVVGWNDDIWEEYLGRINRGGYHIYTTIDMDVQNQVDKIYKNLDNIPDTRSSQQLQSAIVIVDNRTGDIVAMAGGVGNNKEHFGFNRAQTELQSGSSIKPLTIYAPGFQQGSISPATVIKDLPISYSDGAWPKNDDRKYSYTRTVFGGIVSSVNAVAANTLQKIGTTYGFEFARDSFGLTTLIEDDLQIAALALGAQHYGVRVRDMSCAFATFPNKGVYREGRTYTKVYNSKGELVLDNTQESREILNAKAVNYINYCLTNAVTSGTGSGADFYDVDVAGKTGTTSSSRDRWFCGYTGYYTAAVWCGYDHPETISLGFNPAARLWKNVMEPLHNGLENIRMYDSSKMTTVSVCLDSGKIATEACKNDVRGGRVQNVAVYPEDRPTASCNMHVQLDVCTSGNGVATEYCKNFAGVDSSVKIVKKGLLKLNQTAYNEIAKAKSHGLRDEYVRDDYIYLVDGSGKDASFKGFNGNINKNVNAPYKVCTVHTKEAWDEHQKPLIPGLDDLLKPLFPSSP